jgi:hypothetical protein
MQLGHSPVKHALWDRQIRILLYTQPMYAGNSSHKHYSDPPALRTHLSISGSSFSNLIRPLSHCFCGRRLDKAGMREGRGPNVAGLLCVSTAIHVSRPARPNHCNFPPRKRRGVEMHDDPIERAVDFVVHDPVPTRLTSGPQASPWKNRKRHVISDFIAVLVRPRSGISLS